MARRPEAGDQHIGAVQVMDPSGFRDLDDQSAPQVQAVTDQTQNLIQKTVDHQRMRAEVRRDPGGLGLSSEFPDKASDEGQVEGLDHLQLLGQLDGLGRAGVL